MKTLTVHILAGEPSLLLPEMSPSGDLAKLCGADLTSVPAFWLSRQAGRYSHNFLTDGRDDQRVSIFARSLATDYARHQKPFLIIPSLVDAENSTPSSEKLSWAEVLFGLSDELAKLERDCVFHLHLVTAENYHVSEARLQKLQFWLQGLGLQARFDVSSIIHLSRDNDQLERLFRNGQTAMMIKAVSEICHAHGLAIIRSDQLSGYIMSCLANWSRIGVRPVMPLSETVLGRLADAVLSQAFQPDPPVEVKKK